MTTIHIDGNRVFTFDDDEYSATFGDVKTVGELADICAAANEIAGRVFSFKADGVVQKRSAKVPKKTLVLELVEVSDPAVIEAEIAAAAADAEARAAEAAEGAAEPTEPTGHTEQLINDVDAATRFLADNPDEVAVLEYLDDVPDDQRPIVASLLLQAEATSDNPRADLIDALREHGRRSRRGHGVPPTR